MLEFRDHVKNTVQTREGRFFPPYPEHVMEFREAMYQTMKGLNMRGRAPATS